MKKAIVTGATGFIGGALCTLLLEQGIKVYAVGRNQDKLNKLSRKGAVCISKDLNEDISIANDIKDEIDVFFDAAFDGGFDGNSLKRYDLQLNNTKNACNAVNMALEVKTKKFIYVSSTNVIEAEALLNSYEQNPRNTCIYSAAKIAAEIIGKTLAYQGGMEYISALVAMPYGEHNYANTLPNIIIKQLLTGQSPKLIQGDNLYDLVYVDDVAKALYAMGERGQNFKRYYIGHRNLQTFKQILSTVGQILAPQIKLQFGCYPDAPAVDYSKLDLDALYNDTGFECTADFRESILKTAEWLKKEGI